MIEKHGRRQRHGVGRDCTAIFCVGAAVALWPLGAGAAEPPSLPLRARPAVVDHAVVPAGGACRGCREPHCRTCRVGGHRGHHAGCRDGKCHPYCPVRPQEFGFYDTQWRRWPGQGVVPAAHVQDATPARPPKSAVPRIEEESRRTRADELPAPDPSPEAAVPNAPAAQPARPAAESIREPVAEPAPLPVAEPPIPDRSTADEPAALPPPAEPPAQRPAADANLFDESATVPVPRRFVASRGAIAAGRPATGQVRPATLTYPLSVEALPKSIDGDSLRVPQVPFDPAAEAARLGR